MTDLTAEQVRSAGHHMAFGEAAPSLTVVVPARNAAATLGDCLAALRASVCCPHQTIVVDDASTDSTAAVAQSHGAHVVRLERQGGAAVARNAGARLATTKLLFFTDADVMVAPDTLARVVTHLQTDGVDAVFGSYSA